MADVVVIRVSSLPGWADCNRRGAARLFWRDVTEAGYQLRQTPRGIAAAIGTAVHKGVAVMLDEKAKVGALPPASVAEDCAADTLKEQIAEGIRYEDANTGITRSRDDALRQVAGMTGTYQRTVAPAVEPILVEERLEAEVAPGLIISGQPDLVAREPRKVRDLKTGARLSNYFAQAGGYSLLVRAHGYEIDEASIDFIQRVRPGKPQPAPVIKPVPLEAAEVAAVRIVGHMAESLRVFREGDPERGVKPGDPWAFQSNPQSMLCSDRYCPAHSTPFCKDWMPK